MKKIICLLLVLVLAFSSAFMMVSCGNDNSNGINDILDTKDTTEPVESELSETDDVVTDTPEPDDSATETPETEVPETETPNVETPETETPEIDVQTNVPVETDAPVSSDDEPLDTDYPETDYPKTSPADTDGLEEETDIDDPLEPVLPDEEYWVYNNGYISFEYPTYWEVVKDDTAVMLGDFKSNSYMNVVVEYANQDIYTVLTPEMYEEYYKPMYEQSGITVVDYSIGRHTNANGLDFVIIEQKFVAQGIEMDVDQAVVTVERYACVLTFFGIDEDTENHIFNSIDEIEGAFTDDATEGEEPAPMFYTDRVIGIEYPSTWAISEESVGVIMYDNRTGNNVNIVLEPASDIYDALTLEKYDEILRPMYEEYGFTLVDVSIGHQTNANGIEFVSLEQTALISGVEMQINQRMVTVGEYTYVFTFTNVNEDLEKEIFDSICILV